MPPDTSAVTSLDSFREIVGAAHFSSADESDAIDGVVPRWVVEPADERELARALSVANAAGLSVIPRGRGTKLNWGNPPRRADLVVSTHRLSSVVEHAAGDMTATVQAGCTVAQLQRTLAERGQRLAIDPLWPDRATVGGILSTNDSGMLRASFGALRDLIIGITVALPDGTLARSGGKVVKNVAGYDLPKLFTGAFGTLGVITQATFRLHPLPHAVRELRVNIETANDLSVVLSKLSECSLLTCGVQIEAASGSSLSVNVRVEGLPEAIEAKVARILQAVAEIGATTDVTSNPPLLRESLFDAPQNALICKVVAPPAGFPKICESLPSAQSDTVTWKLVAQAIGVGLLRLESPQIESLPDMLGSIRASTETHGATIVVLCCPPTLAARVERWNNPGDAVPLMRRIKTQFDAAGTLNPGRFIGGI